MVKGGLPATAYGRAPLTISPVNPQKEAPGRVAARATLNLIEGKPAMARVTAPLLSFGASGQIGKTQVYATWKGVPYVRRHVIPSNPNSSEQALTRNAFSWINSVWKVAPADFRSAWALFAKGQALTDRNAFLKFNLPILRPAVVVTDMVLSPGAKGGLVGDITVTPGNDLITVTGTPPDPLPPGWIVTRLIAACIRQQNPQSGVLFDIVVGDDVTDPYSVVLAGLASAQTYLAGGWFEYQKSALATDLAYGPAVSDLALTT
jgi:hypothetical protein